MPPAKKSTAPAKKSAPKKASKAKATPAPAPVEEPQVVEDAPVEEKKTRTRRVVTSETVAQLFEEILTTIDEQIEKQRKLNDRGNRGIKALRHVRKLTNQASKDVSKLLTKKQRQPRRQGSNSSGFMKKVPVSAEMSKFCGWPDGELHSRVDVTKQICNYIKEHDLRNPADRRQIHLDDKLRNLFDVDGLREDARELLEKGTKKPAHYFDLQRLIQPHFQKVEEPAE